jgi:hypothetical protein
MRAHRWTLIFSRLTLILHDGEQFMLTRRIIPDINFNQSDLGGTTPQVNITVRPRNFPGSQYQNDPSDTQGVIETTADIFTNQIFVRARARQLAIKVVVQPAWNSVAVGYPEA